MTVSHVREDSMQRVEVTVNVLTALRLLPKEMRSQNQTELLENVEKSRTMLSKINRALEESARLSFSLLSVLGANSESTSEIAHVHVNRLLTRLASGEDFQIPEAVSIQSLVAYLEEQLRSIMDLTSELQTMNQETYIVSVPGATTLGMPKTIQDMTGRKLTIPSTTPEK